jgi:hypothetical protein
MYIDREHTIVSRTASDEDSLAFAWWNESIYCDSGEKYTLIRRCQELYQLEIPKDQPVPSIDQLRKLLAHSSIPDPRPQPFRQRASTRRFRSSIFKPLGAYYLHCHRPAVFQSSEGANSSSRYRVLEHQFLDR